MKQLCENRKAILTRIHYDELNWYICADFNVVAKITGISVAKLIFPASYAYGASEQERIIMYAKGWPIQDNIE